MPWKAVVLTVAFAILAVTVWMGRYQFEPTDRAIGFRLDRWTGAVVVYAGKTGTTVTIDRPPPPPSLVKPSASEFLDFSRYGTPVQQELAIPPELKPLEE